MKLVRIDRDRYRIISDGVSVEGRLAFVVETMRDTYGVLQGEIQMGLIEMWKLGHEVAEFSDTLSKIRALEGDEYHGPRFIRTHEKLARSSSVLLELQAIQQVKEEAVKQYNEDGWASPRVKETIARLESLYATLNISTLITIIEDLEYQKVA